MVPDEKNPVDQVLDLFVFAPLGLALTARNQLPEMVAKGRAQVEGQLAMARFIGQFAVQQGKVEVEKRLKTYTNRTPPAAGAARVADDLGDLDDLDDRGDLDDVGDLSVPEDPTDVVADPPPEVVGPSREADAPPPLVADLAVPGYDSLSASQVVQRLAGLSPAELEQVRRYEAATRGRKTVLTKISQLQ